VCICCSVCGVRPWTHGHSLRLIKREHEFEDTKVITWQESFHTCCIYASWDFYLLCMISTLSLRHLATTLNTSENVPILRHGCISVCTAVSYSTSKCLLYPPNVSSTRLNTPWWASSRLSISQLHVPSSLSIYYGTCPWKSGQQDNKLHHQWGRKWMCGL